MFKVVWTEKAFKHPYENSSWKDKEFKNMTSQEISRNKETVKEIHTMAQVKNLTSYIKLAKAFEVITVTVKDAES